MSRFIQSGMPSEVRARTSAHVSTRPMGLGHAWPERGEVSRVVRTFAPARPANLTRAQLWANARRYGQV